MATAFMFKGPAALTGASTAAALTTSGAVSIGSTLGVTGTTTLAAATLAGATSITGAVTFSGGGASLAMGDKKITGVADPVDNQDVATKAYVIANAGGGSALVNINGTGTTALAANTTYFISVGSAATITCTVTGLSPGDIVRFVAESVGGDITLTGSAGLFKVVGGSATNLVLDTQGQGLQFVHKAGGLWLVGGGYSSSSS
jgi:hypothetical protein